METVIIDTREKARAIRSICAEFDMQGVKYVSSKLYVGDYQLISDGTNVVDRKQNLLELCGNVCQQHKRFCAELLRAKEAGITLTVLCEHGGGIRRLEDVKGWVNPRLKESPMAVSGERLYRILTALGVKYGVRFEFCTKNETGARILDILRRDGKRRV